MKDLSRTLLIACAALAGAAACDNPPAAMMDAGIRRDGGPRDTGTPMEDGGPVDTGMMMPDAGTDGGRPETFNVRIAHFIPGGPGVELCFGTEIAGMLLSNNQVSVPGVGSVVPYPGISPYLTGLTLDRRVTYVLRVYADDQIDATRPASEACSMAGPMGMPVPVADPLITLRVVAATLTDGGYYTVAAVGLPGGAAGTPAEPHAIVIEDDLTAPAAGMQHVRLVHTIPNLPAAVDVCFDADGPAGPMTPVELFDDVSFEEATPYSMQMPITAGTFAVHAHMMGVPDCNDATRIMGPIPVPFPIPAGPPQLVSTFQADRIHSVFAIGDATRASMPLPCTMPSDCTAAGPPGTTCSPTTGRCTHPLGPSVVPWHDNWTPPAP